MYIGMRDVSTICVAFLLALITIAIFSYFTVLARERSERWLDRRHDARMTRQKEAEHAAAMYRAGASAYRGASPDSWFPPRIPKRVMSMEDVCLLLLVVSHFIYGVVQFTTALP